jgi:hypothetical protein
MMSTLPSLSRRTFLSGAASLIAEAAFASSRIQDDELKASVSGAAFRQAGNSAKISTKTLRENLSLVAGSGGNILLCHGADGNATVDSGLATSHRQVSAAIHQVSPRITARTSAPVQSRNRLSPERVDVFHTQWGSS